MTLEKWTGMSFEAYYTGRILALLPSDLPSMREARIQNGKLYRMLNERKQQDTPYEAGIRALRGGSTKKWIRAEGKRVQLAGQQARKVRALSDKVFKEFLRIDTPQLTNTEFREWRKQFDSGMSEAAHKFTQEVMQHVSLKIGAASHQLPGHRK